MLFILHTLIRARWLIILAGLGSAIIMAVVSFLLPVWFTATSSVFPPEPNQFGAAGQIQLAQALQMPVMGPNAAGMIPSSIYVDILNSRRVGERIIDEFNLREVYGIPITSKTLERLQSHTFFELVENGLLRISVEDRDPQRAADLTNRFIELLDDFNKQLNITRASRTKEFIEEQMERTKKDLRVVEEELRDFQEKHKALELGSQVQQSLSVASGLTADAIALEIDLELLRQYASQNSQEYIRKKKRYDEIIRQLRKIGASSERDEDDIIRAFFPTLERVPELQLELARLTRRVVVEETVYGLLVEEFEKSSIEEARDTPTVQVLDEAKVPELKSRPKRGIIAVAGGVAGVGWSSLLALWLAVWRDEKGRGAAVRAVIEPVLADFRRPFRRKRSD